VLTKEPEMLQPDTFYEHTIQQNATAAGPPPRTPLRELTAFPCRPLAGFKGTVRGGEGEGKRGRKGKGKGREGHGWRGWEGRLTHAQLEQGRRLAKAGPVR